ncbi:MAG: phosphoribosyltransferase family protein [Erysipelothrix sp.]
MKLLEDKIKECGFVATSDILDVSQFLNAQVDVELMQQVGKDFAEYYKDYDFDIFVTVESSGIAPSVFASLYANKPLVVIKKDQTEKDSEIFAQQACYSYTKKNAYYLTTRTQLIKNKKAILIDDFLAQGSVVKNVELLLKSVNATHVATGICISKNYQPGYQKLIEEGHDLYCQAQIKSLDAETNIVEFES